MWFLKSTNYCSNINIERIKEKLNGSHNIIIRDSKRNGSKTYLCKFETITNEEQNKNYPSYYKDYYELTGLWIKLTSIEKIEHFDLFARDLKTLAGNSMFNVLKSSATMVYFEAVADIH